MISASGFYWAGNRGLQFHGAAPQSSPDVLLYFVDKKIAADTDVYAILREIYPDAILFGCSTSAPVLFDDVYAGTFTGVALTFEKTKLKAAQRACSAQDQSYEVGKALVGDLLAPGLRHVFVITDGLGVHGDSFLNGANAALPKGATISGGMASDAFEFKETLCGINRPIATGQVCALGFYGDDLTVGFGAEGGWDAFGLERVVTRSEGNVLYELDGLPALDLYKGYLGPEADKLPGSGLLFPLAIRKDQQSKIIVRTIDVVDEAKKSLRFSGDIPEGYVAQFMKGNFRHLVDGAEKAAGKSIPPDMVTQGNPSVALVVSCIGRQLLMGQKISDELEAVCTSLGDNVVVSGFYSNGEFSKNGYEPCVLHNQTMTLTLIQEK